MPIILYVASGLCFLFSVIIIIRNKPMPINYTSSPYLAAGAFIGFGVIIFVSGGQIDSIIKASNFFRAGLTKARQERDSLQSKVAQLSDNNSQLQHKIKTTRKAYEDKIANINQIKNELDKKTASLNNELDLAQVRLDKFSKTNQKLKADLTTFQKENNNLKLKISEAYEALISDIDELSEKSQKTQRNIKSALIALEPYVPTTSKDRSGMSPFMEIKKYNKQQHTPSKPLPNEPSTAPLPKNYKKKFIDPSNKTSKPPTKFEKPSNTISPKTD